MAQPKNARNTGTTNQGNFGSGSGTAVATRPSTPKVSGKSTPTQDQIAKRAHEIWVKRGCKPGMDRQNWFEAEAQLRAELARK